MKILLVSQWYAPEPSAKSTNLAQGLAERGHEVEVVTSFPSYPLGRTYDGYRQKFYTREEHDGVSVIRVPSYPDHSRSAVKRLVSYGSFALNAATIGNVLAKQADVVWAYHPPPTTGYAASALARKRKAPLVLEVQDMWPETLGATGLGPAPWLQKTVGRAMNRLYHKATAISVISPGFKSNLIVKGVTDEKIHVIPNWALGTPKDPTAPDSEVGKREGLTGRFNVMFAGVMGPAQGLQNVLDAAMLLTDLPTVQIVFVGDGVDAPGLKKRAQDLGLTNVRFCGRRPESEMPALFAHADVLLVHLKDDPLFRITIPSKTMAYLSSGRPILSATAGDPAAVIEGAGAGLSCEPDNPKALADAIRSLALRPKAELDSMGAAGRRAYVTRYSRDVLLDQYESLFERATGIN